MKLNLNDKKLLPINLQLFGDGGTDGGAEGSEGTETGTDEQPKPEGAEKKDDKPPDDKTKTDNNKKYEAKIKKLESQIEAMQKEKMSEAERKKFDDDKRAKELAEKEAALKDRENKLYAVKAIKDIGIDCGSEDLSNLTALVTVGVEGAEEIDSRIKSVKAVIDSVVQAECDRRFKEAGRTPKGAGKATEEENNIAKRLGARRAESDKKAKSILDYYTKR